MARRQALVQLSDELLAALDERRSRAGRSRSDLIREAVERYLVDDIESDLDRQIVEGYRRHPPDDLWGEESVKRVIAQEPW